MPICTIRILFTVFLLCPLCQLQQLSQYNKNVCHLSCHSKQVANLYCKSEQLMRGSFFCAQDKFDRGIYSLAYLKYDHILIPLVPIRNMIYGERGIIEQSWQWWVICHVTIKYLSNASVNYCSVNIVYHLIIEKHFHPSLTTE